MFTCEWAGHTTVNDALPCHCRVKVRSVVRYNSFCSDRSSIRAQEKTRKPFWARGLLEVGHTGLEPVTSCVSYKRDPPNGSEQAAFCAENIPRTTYHYPNSGANVEQASSIDSCDSDPRWG